MLRESDGMYAEQRQPDAVSNKLGLACLVAVLLAALPGGAGCTHWVPYFPNLSDPKTRQIDDMRIDGSEVYRDVTIQGDSVVATKTHPETIDLRLIPPQSVHLTPDDAAAIERGKTRKLKQVSVGEDLFVKATIKGPTLTGYKRLPLNLLGAQRVEIKEVDPVRVAPFAILPLVGVLVVVGLGVVLWAGWGSSCPGCGA